VLPVYNGESTLGHAVEETLELASEMTSQFSILIVDDGSTDDTLEVARELAARFPQVSVLREPIRRGLGPVIEKIAARIPSEVVFVHDGVSPLDMNQLQALWRQEQSGHLARENQPMQSNDTIENSLQELRNIPALHASLAHAHQPIVGFHAIQPTQKSEELSPSEQSEATPEESVLRTGSHQRKDSHGVGQIPPLPRPNFLSAIAEFAIGE